MDRVLDVLKCPVCSHILFQPTTLRCGHSICASHMSFSNNLSQCPVQSCSIGPSNQASQAGPLLSKVSYFPAPNLFTSSPTFINGGPRLDVTLCKVLDIVHRNSSMPSNSAPGSDALQGGTYEDHDGNLAPTHRTSQLHSRTTNHSRSCSSSPQNSPRKRMRRISPSRTSLVDDTHELLDHPEEDILTHLIQQSLRQRAIPTHVPILESVYDCIPDDTSATASSLELNQPNADALARETLERFQKDLLVELTCEICYSVLYQPLTTLCQHTFCDKCLHRSLDHSSCCPLCRQDLPICSHFKEHPWNKVILALLTSSGLSTLADAYSIRAESIAAEERHARLDTPIFVCQLSFPSMPTLLHFFEPRYRLMLRRCLESPTPSFGMIMPPRPGATTTIPTGDDSTLTTSQPIQMDYGTMLEIRSVQMLSDGRSMVETWGAWRFRVLERGILDGYMVGRIERIDDFPDDLLEDDGGGTTDDDTLSISSNEKGKGKDESTILHESAELSGKAISLPSNNLQPTSSAVILPSHVSSHNSTQEPVLRRSRPYKSYRRPTSDMSSSTVPLSTPDLISHCLSFLDTLNTGTAPWVSQRLNHPPGFSGISLETLLNPIDPTPEDDAQSYPPPTTATLSFYIATLLPIDESEKAKLLPVRSARMRLQMCVWWIEGLRRHWWFDKGCVIL